MSGIGGTTKRDTEIRLPRATKVKNKQPAAQQACVFLPCLTRLQF